MSIDRRGFFSWVGGGLATAAAASLMLRDGTLQAAVPGESDPRCPHFAPKAKRAIHICLCGAMSQVDSFDRKPELIASHGQVAQARPPPATTSSSARSACSASPTGSSAKGANPASGSPTCSRTSARSPTS